VESPPGASNPPKWWLVSAKPLGFDDFQWYPNTLGFLRNFGPKCGPCCVDPVCISFNVLVCTGRHSRYHQFDELLTRIFAIENSCSTTVAGGD